MTQTHDCERAGDLVAYIYGEAQSTEAEDFARHLTTCATCREEAVGFGIVREDFAVWRAAAPELTGAHAARFVAEHVAASSVETNERAGFAESHHARDADRSRSLHQAWRALSELFRVTPRWAQACGAAAMLALCTLAGVSLNNFTQTTDAPDQNAKIVAAVSRPDTETRIAAPDESEIESRINREVARRLAEREQVNVSANPQPITTTAALRDNGLRARSATRRSPARPRREANRSPAETFDEADLPRLSDLLDGAE